ncbi:rRNA processing/ribosome biogenesis-domain-containing protein [Crucibulum laeve]|uniref:Pre-rRNA-processing protein RIX1 n=1 Tax=Crucibulum laeve TaxID=68775 RepID=A0A5C3MR03_9AGAR|nr:rRNA processing/ribosome biogenesis-domain-containing protein [Crucibulum laeve]
MQAAEHLKLLLQLQLASDPSAVLHLSYVLSTLTPQCFFPSSHLSKWTTRINALMHSKDPGARWAGLCLAHKTSVYSRTVMIEFAHTWLGVAIPMLLKSEPLPTLKAAIRLTRTIFSSAIEVSEFQRQVSTPNVPKFSSALISLAEKYSDLELKVACLETLTKLIPLYPTTNRSSHSALSALCLRFLNGSAPAPTDGRLLKAASSLYATLHLTGGKVGAANIWRKSLDETLSFAWGAFLSVRTTFPSEVRNAINGLAITNDDPISSISLNLDRLRCSVVILNDLLSATTHRPVQVPVGYLVKLIAALLMCDGEEKIEGFIDAEIRAMEVSLVPSLWEFGCQMLMCLAECVQYHLDPYLSRLASMIAFRLEQNMETTKRLSFLDALNTLLIHCHTLNSPLIPTRLAKAVLPSLSVVLTSAPDAPSLYGNVMSTKDKKGKKKARNYEGEEVFKVSREVVCQTSDDGKVLLAALRAIELLLHNPNLSAALHSLTSRILLAMLLALPKMSPALLSVDPSLYSVVYQRVQTICIELSIGTTSVMGKGLPLIIEDVLTDGQATYSQRMFDLLLHPRIPPLVRSMPHVEALSLFHVEESQEEIDAREALELSTSKPKPTTITQDITMEDHSASTAAPVIPNETQTPIIPAVSAPLAFSANVPGKFQDIQQMTASAIPMEMDPIRSLAEPLVEVTTKKAVYSQVSISQTRTIHAPIEDDDDEDMPTINTESDSEED